MLPTQPPLAEVADSYATSEECQYCEPISQTWDWYDRPGPIRFLHFPDLGSEKWLCLTCALISESTRKLYPDRQGGDISLWVLPGYQVMLHPDHPETRFEIFTLESQKQCPGVPIKRLLPGSTSSQATLRTITGWIEQCTQSHNQCRVRTGPSGFSRPKRLLDLQHGKIRLQDDNISGRESVPKYACLSHCWGFNPLVRTTLDTIEQFKEEISPTDLSQTFLDAVDICRRLDIPYLWIDSLCIIQDSATDWENESARMAGIYENAFLTVAATKSSDGTGGLYSQTDKKFMDYLELNAHGLKIRRMVPQIPTGKLNREDTKEWPLLSRGWVYQERRLSMRTLHFANQEVIWECKSCRWCESGAHDHTHMKPQARPHASEQWHRDVEAYTQLALTFDRDKFPALAAIAQRSSEAREGQDIYVCGLWRNTLLNDLLWQAPLRPTTKSRVRGIPSWSWAAPNREVHYKNSKEDTEVLPFVRVQKLEYRDAGPHFFGRFETARLTIRGILLSMTRIGSTLKGTPKDRLGSEAHHFMQRYFTCAFWDHPDSSPLESSGYPVCLLLLATIPRHYRYTGLILRPIPQNNSYERIGLLTMDLRDGRSPENFQRQHEEDGQYLSHLQVTDILIE